MKLFISYHLADTKSVIKIKDKLDNLNMDYYSVPEDMDFRGWHNEQISKYILKNMEGCEVLLSIIGKETYTRPHVDYEIHQALKGGVGTRKGIIAVLLENRNDTIYEIDFSTFPPRLADNIDYLVLVQNASLKDQLSECLDQAIENRNNRKMEVNNTRKCMKLPNKYYE